MTDWRELQAKAQLPSDALMFNSSVTATALNSCNQLLGYLLLVKQHIPNVNNLKPFAGPSSIFWSGTKLAMEFSTQADNLDRIVQSHVDIVNAMADTFKAAGIAYAKAENQSTDAFKDILNTTTAGRPTTPKPFLPDSYRPSYDVPVPGAPRKTPELGYPAKTVKPEVQTYGPLLDRKRRNLGSDHKPPSDTRAVPPENAFSKPWVSFYQLGESINAGTIAFAAENWEWMANQLANGFALFRSDGPKMRSGWTGAGADAALKAIEDYTADTEGLTLNMKYVSSRLYDLASSLRETRVRMPTTPQDPAEQDKSGKTESRLKYIQEDCDAYYIAGIIRYNSELLTLKSPKSRAGLALPPQEAAPEVPAPAAVPGVNTGGGAGANGGGGGTPQLTTPETPTTPTTPETPTTPTTPDTGDLTSALESASEAAQNLLSSATDSADTSSLGDAANSAQEAAQDATEDASSALEQGLEAAQQAAEESLQAAQEGVETAQENSALNGVAPTGLAGLPTSAGGGGGGGGSRAGLGGGAAAAAPLTRDATQSRLFPRAAAITTADAMVSRAGITAGATGAAGAPGMSPAAAGQGQGQGKEHKRPQYLNSTENLDEALGDAPVVVRPVVER
ncbi:hypothetical protein ACSVDM_04180 [Nocardia sp. JW2]|uniref:hypothetical protein n=1 Tax=Nocardia sp. JW2 TaxID=3450738 RepID=UPI003F42AA2D